MCSLSSKTLGTFNRDRKRSNSQPHSVRLPHGFYSGTDRLFIEPAEAVSTHCRHDIESVIAEVNVHTNGARRRTALQPSD